MQVFRYGPSLITSSELSKRIYIYIYMSITYIDIFIYIYNCYFAHGSSEHFAYFATHIPSPPHPSLLEDYLFTCNTKN